MLNRMIVAIAVTALATGSANAAQIYFDNFDGPGAGGLDFTLPDVSTTNELWVARHTFRADGSFTWENGATMSLAFTPADGRVYTLDAKFEILTGNHWVQFGFGNGNDQTGWTGRAWHLLRVAEDGSNPHHTFLNGFADGAAWSTLGLLRYDEPLDARIVLDTTGGPGQWRVWWYAKADSDPTWTVVRTGAIPTATDINSVGVSLFNTSKSGKLLSFSLSDDLPEIPEPASLALLGLGGLALMRRK